MSKSSANCPARRRPQAARAALARRTAPAVRLGYRFPPSSIHKARRYNVVVDAALDCVAMEGVMEGVETLLSLLVLFVKWPPDNNVFAVCTFLRAVLHLLAAA
mmetsp:Transcript_43503/g.125741  ORF Transcript_43503/g.125741 Transcript_43503/m.125741 type:complete len:103 (-) Transcript_43503:2474-2782(-)